MSSHGLSNSKWGFILSLGFVWLICSQWQAAAEDLVSPSSAQGHDLSQKLCVSCHLIDEKPGGIAKVGPPTFRSIANQPGQSAERIRNVLINPHPPMPDIHLSNEEILNIIAYLETMRTDKSTPPLLAPTGAEKPKYPARS